jgi:predicted transport protein
MKDGFIESGLRLNKFISDFDQWNEESIKKRAEFLSKLSIQRWPYFNDIFPDKKELEQKRMPTEEEHLEIAEEEISSLYFKIKEEILKISDEIDISPQKKYIAFKARTNFVDIEIQKEAIKAHINMKKGTLLDPANKCDDMSNKGHYGNGEYQIFLYKESDIDYFLMLAKQSYTVNS